MAMTAYTGVQGSGKSYETVQNVIIPNLASGRRIVTNIAGLNIDLIADYISLHRDKFGCDDFDSAAVDLVNVTNEQIGAPGFFPVEGADNSGVIVRAGDLIIIDECWRWYASGQELPAGHLEFFRMHRHYTHPDTGVSCDIVFIVQSIVDLQRKVRATIEKTFLMQKHKDLGMPDRYVVSVFGGNSTAKTRLIEQFQKKYDPEIFPLYSSYSQGNGAAGKELAADKRGNLFGGLLFKLGIPLAIFGISGSVWFAWKFFHPEQPQKTVQGAVPVVAGVSTAKPAPVEIKKPDSPPWRLLGTFTRSGVISFYLLDDSSGRLRVLTAPPNYKIGMIETEVALPTGEVVTFWTGSPINYNRQVSTASRDVIK